MTVVWKPLGHDKSTQALVFFYLQTGCFVLFGYYYYFFRKSINQPSYTSKINSRYIINNSARAHWFFASREKEKYIYDSQENKISALHTGQPSISSTEGKKKKKKKKKKGKREVKTWKKMICV